MAAQFFQSKPDQKNWNISSYFFFSQIIWSSYLKVFINKSNLKQEIPKKDNLGKSKKNRLILKMLVKGKYLRNFGVY